MKKNKRKTFLFDFDGTLVDSMPTFVAVMLRILDENGIEYDEDIVKIITPLGYHGTAEYYRTLGVDQTVEQLMATMNEYAVDEYTHNIIAKDTVMQTLFEMKARGYSLNVLTASPHAALDPCLKRIGAWELFDNVWSCDDFNTTKADPEIYKMAAERIGVSVGEVIFVDDNFNAVQTAKEAGAVAMGIYDDSSADYVDEFKSMAHGYVYRFEELLDEQRLEESREKLKKGRLCDAALELVLEVVFTAILIGIGYFVLRILGMDDTSELYDLEGVGLLAVIVIAALCFGIYTAVHFVRKKRKKSSEKEQKDGGKE